MTAKLLSAEVLEEIRSANEPLGKEYPGGTSWVALRLLDHIAALEAKLAEERHRAVEAETRLIREMQKR